MARVPGLRMHTLLAAVLQGKEKEMKSIYRPIALFYQASQSAQTWITQFYLQITPCLPFLRKRSPDVATPSEVADI